MNKILHITLISLFSLTVFSCSDDKEEHSATGTTDDTTTTAGDDSETKKGYENYV